MQHMTTTYGIAIHHRYHRFGQSANLHLNIEYTQTGHTFLVHIASTSFHMHVTSRAERLVASTRQQYHPDVLHLTAQGKSLTQFQCCLWCKRITISRTINGNLCNTMILFEEDFFELLNLFPFSLYHIISCFVFDYKDTNK